jgi:hypothetical protein
LLFIYLPTNKGDNLNKAAVTYIFHYFSIFNGILAFSWQVYSRWMSGLRKETLPRQRLWEGE